MRVNVSYNPVAVTVTVVIVVRVVVIHGVPMTVTVVIVVSVTVIVVMCVSVIVIMDYFVVVILMEVVMSNIVVSVTMIVIVPIRVGVIVACTTIAVSIIMTVGMCIVVTRCRIPMKIIVTLVLLNSCRSNEVLISFDPHTTSARKDVVVHPRRSASNLALVTVSVYVMLFVGFDPVTSNDSSPGSANENARIAPLVLIASYVM